MEWELFSKEPRLYLSLLGAPFLSAAASIPIVLLVAVTTALFVLTALAMVVAGSVVALIVSALGLAIPVIGWIALGYLALQVVVPLLEEVTKPLGQFKNSIIELLSTSRMPLATFYLSLLITTAVLIGASVGVGTAMRSTMDGIMFGILLMLPTAIVFLVLWADVYERFSRAARQAAAVRKHLDEGVSPGENDAMQVLLEVSKRG